MKIAVVGCGAMGSIYAARLAGSGNDVIIVDTWKEHVDTINRDGLVVDGVAGKCIAHVRAFTDIPEEKVDLVIVSVKAAHVETTAGRIGRLMDDHTKVLTIQNGVGSAEVLAEHIPPERLCIGVAKAFGAIMRGPGHAYHNSMNEIRIGAFSDLPAADVESIVSVWRAAGFNVSPVADVLAMQWEKLICNVAYSAPCALTGLTVGEMMDHPDMGPVSRAAAVEAWTVAHALGIKIKVDDPVKLVRDFAAGMPTAKPSMLQDHENGRASEIDVINGAVPKAAIRAGIATPVNDTLVALVKAKERSFLA